LAGFDLSGQVAIVTGGSDGIGKGIALAMAEAGADIVVAARQQAKIDAAVAEIERTGRRAVGVSVDVSDPAQTCVHELDRGLQRLQRIA
jgi:7-alpha-hydroxysteroid dehydrogenase